MGPEVLMSIWSIGCLIVTALIAGLFIYTMILAIKALKKYLNP